MSKHEQLVRHFEKFGQKFKKLIKINKSGINNNKVKIYINKFTKYKNLQNAQNKQKSEK